MSKHDLTSERLHEVLSYEPGTGLFLRRVNSRRRPDAFIPAGAKTVNGYITIFVDGCSFAAHRLAWLYVHGAWPNGDVDHINGSRQDNRMENLRSVTRIVNAQNRRVPSRSKSSGLPLGVSRKRTKLVNPYSARITVNGKPINLGYFAEPESAHAAYLSAKRNMHDGCTI